MSNSVLSEEQKSLLKNGPSFVPTPTDINWYEVRKDFTKFTNKIRHHAGLDQQQEKVHPQVNSNEPTINENKLAPGKPPPKSNPYEQLYRSKPSTNNSVELFIKSIEKELFNLNNIRKTRDNLSKEEKLTLKEMTSWDDKVICVKDKGSRFAFLDTNSYIEKVENQINRSSFDKLDADPSPKFKEKVNNWLEKWSDIITNEWKELIRPDNCNAGKMYGMVKTHKADNPVRVITSGCNTVVEKLSILVEIADGRNSKIKDTNNVLEIMDNINKSMLSENCVLVSFDVVNMFPNIDNKSGLLSVKEALTNSSFDADSTQSIVDALEICLTCNNSKFN